MNKNLTISDEAKAVIKSYFELPLGGKKVPCPYYMNLKHERAGLRVMIGKGTAEEIVHEVLVWAQLKGILLSKMSVQEIRGFMIKKGIGIDCSGFAAYVLDAQLRKLGKGRLWRNLEYRNNSLYSKFRRFLRPVENIGANLLTSELNCVPIADFDEIKPGDMIRAKGKIQNAHHVAVITDVFFNSNGKINSFEYVHSHRFYEDENGVRKGKVTISNPKKSLKDQEWHDEINGRNYMLEDLLVDYKDNGIRRLKALA